MKNFSELKSIFIFVLLSLVIVKVHCFQRNDTIPLIHFQLTDASNGTPIPLAHVMNMNLMKGTIADMLGYFSMKVRDMDTLLISAIGYHDMRLPVWGQFSPDSSLYYIRLTPRSYEIREIKITRFGSYQSFIKEAASMELPKSEAEVVRERLEKYFRETITRLELKSAPQQSSGVMFGKDWIAIQKEKIEVKRAEEIKWDIILKKFSASIVTELTGLEGSDAIRFMEYCGFTEGFLLIASDYEVRKRLVDIYTEYQNKKQNELNTHTTNKK